MQVGGSVRVEGGGLGDSTGRGWGSLMRGRGRRRGRTDLFVLTAVMHGVAGDDHRRSHGDGGAPHGELVGDGIVGTTVAETRLARGGSWKGGVRVSAGPAASGHFYSVTCGRTLDNSCAHDGAHPGVGVVYNSRIHCDQSETKAQSVG